MIPLCAVYCNTLLANLNARAYVMGTETTFNVDLDLFSGPSSRPPQGDEIVFAAHSALSKTTEVATFSDTNRSAPQMNVTPLLSLDHVLARFHLWHCSDIHITMHWHLTLTVLRIRLSRDALAMDQRSQHSTLQHCTCRESIDNTVLGRND
ncbi:hypothetical protein JVT61DRAFT_7166 [Boletus reticuloceps]|uniref:Uncharacterized protein n=1 Tax=Boletus reticuloceps TaxID=495285 RepID=A0A8I3A785_9AGAM|nr:hypothetical protein JVT61DRAFT_7166 [Boletus reticuloceps]